MKAINYFHLLILFFFLAAHNLNTACAASTVIGKIQKAVDDLPLREYALYKEKNFRLNPQQLMVLNSPPSNSPPTKKNLL